MLCYHNSSKEVYYEKQNQRDIKFAYNGMNYSYRGYVTCSCKNVYYYGTFSVDKVIKDVKKEYEATLPKGATHSTVVATPSGNPQGGNGNSDKQVAYDKMGNILKDVVS